MNRIKAIWKNEQGSEATEMVATMAMLLALILSALMILSYVVEYNAVHTATKRLTRGVETTGIVSAPTMRADFNRMLGSSSLLQNRSVEITNATYVYGNANYGHIQLKRTFKVTGSCVFEIPLVNPGGITAFSIRLPISASVTGMSEVYWPT